ncbi:hypothetical protein JAAARDRAFT_32380 [Jaapia argillacea MUCL 33604]|uniref:Uncharacterized protein n=1 Tax=Jaapia argillacea MUCL 33604 TaxID=933084 RepID=A0A067Q1I8_9AGAM|nr:hypothetical protein JAAARDRAFT_32380 [Jaapia argillacea MUCL 33604]
MSLRLASRRLIPKAGIRNPAVSNVLFASSHIASSSLPRPSNGQRCLVPSQNYRTFSTSPFPRNATEAPDSEIPNRRGTQASPSDAPLKIFEDRASILTPENDEIIVKLAQLELEPDATKYFKLIMHHIQLLGMYLNNVDVETFRSSPTEQDSSIARGREALVSLASAIDRWMEFGARASTPETLEDPELQEVAKYIKLNTRIIDMYRQNALPEGQTWENVCDIIILSLYSAHEPLEKVVSGGSSVVKEEEEAK